MSLVPPPQEASDIFSLSDQALSERYQFVEEIGFGNWGSVWLCRPKDDEGRPIEGGRDVASGKVAVKLVHRSKTPTTAARVRSLWNEMKIVRSFKLDPHPSIIPFHNFIITPSYALITMSYLPTLVPVEVPELRARPWFLSLVSAVAFLHARGVVHNDIKPANILLTAAEPPVPVLVDFGFAEKYDLRSPKSFLSNLAYGTPEYLSPERARGLPHDTRKSDVWSLGVTLFEILAGRTPFEHAEPDGTTETFSTKADLEKYWARTVKGKWVGKWAMSKGLEKLLRKMILPNADLRITAPVALNDPYFDPTKPETPRNIKSRTSLHKRSTSDADSSRLVDLAPPWSDRSNSGLSPPASLLKTVAAASRRENKENLRGRALPTGKENVGVNPRRENLPGHQKTKSQINMGKAAAAPTRLPQPFKQAVRKAESFHVNSVSPSSPAPVSIPLPPHMEANGSMCTVTSITNVSLPSSANLNTHGNISFVTASSFASKEDSVSSSRTGSGRRVPARKPVSAIFGATHKGKKAEESDGKALPNPIFEERSREKEKERRRKGRVLIDLTKTKTNETVGDKEPKTPAQERSAQLKAPLSPVAEVLPADSPRLFPNDTFPGSIKESIGIDAIKQSIKQSLDKGVRLYKSSTLGSYSNLLSRQSTGGLSVVTPEISQCHESERESPTDGMRESWETESAVRNAKSSLPVVQHAIHNKQVAADNRLDRMTIWIRNVEKVVEDARASFAAGGMTPLPPLPPRVAHSRTASRRGMKVDQIFCTNSPAPPVASASAEDRELSRPRRVTLLSRSPEASVVENLERSPDGPSVVDKETRRNKAQSALNLSRPITPPSKLHLEVEQPDIPCRSPTRLSAVLDPNAFFSSKPSDEQQNTTANAEHSATLVAPSDSSRTSPPPGLQGDRNVEDAYERFLLSTSSVKRIGKGYQSNLITSNIVSGSVSSFKRDPTQFHSVRRDMQSQQEGPRKAASADELGALNSAFVVSPREDGNSTIKLVRRAFRAITGGSVSRRLVKAV